MVLPCQVLTIAAPATLDAKVCFEYSHTPRRLADGAAPKDFKDMSTQRRVDKDHHVEYNLLQDGALRSPSRPDLFSTVPSSTEAEVRQRRRHRDGDWGQDVQFQPVKEL